MKKIKQVWGGVGGLLSLGVRDSPSEEETFEPRPEGTQLWEVLGEGCSRQRELASSGAPTCKGSPWQAVGDEGLGRAEAGCREVLLAMVRSLGFIGNAVGEARGFNIGHIRFSFCVRDHCSCWVEDCRSQEPKWQGPSYFLIWAGPERKASGQSQQQTPHVTGVTV